MERLLRGLLFWLPRVLGLLFAGFLSLFALDVFGAGDGIWQTLAALLIHLIPALALLAAVALSWRWTWLGGLGLLGFALWYIAASGGRAGAGTYLLLVGLPLLIGLLFLLDWRYRDTLQPSRLRQHH